MALELAQISETASTTREDGPLRRVARNLFPFVVVGAIWEVVAHAGLFPPRFFPPLEAIAAVFARLTMNGVLPHHALDTLARLTAGFVLAALVGVTIGILMGRSRRAEDILLPLVSIGAPIPGLAYAPLFLLWFGPGNVSAIALVAFVSTFPIIYNMTGLRLGLAQAWRILVGIEMLAAVSWGLGWLIFGAQEFLNTDVMLAGIVVIGLIGLALEKLVFERLEEFTVVRWGMLTS
jgi:NitT/TauT family transport system permease protein